MGTRSPEHLKVVDGERNITEIAIGELPYAS